MYYVNGLDGSSKLLVSM